MDTERLIIVIISAISALACGMALGFLLWLGKDNSR